jgi:hypothetical protein
MSNNNCIGPTNIIPNNNQVVLLDNNKSITVIDNNCCTNVDVTQPITQVVQILTGPIGAAGAPGALPTSGSLNLTGSINVSGSITANSFFGDLFGTASYALTASYVLNGGLTYAIVTGSITASVDVGNTIFFIKSGSYTPFSISNTGAVTISGSASNLLTVKNANNTNVLAVSQSGVVILATSSIELTGTAPNGGIYFTSSSLFIGLD